MSDYDTHSDGQQEALLSFQNTTSSQSMLSSDVSQQCTKIVEEFRPGNKGKLSAILNIQASIPHQLLDNSTLRSAM
jgi:hypothetical protein